MAAEQDNISWMDINRAVDNSAEGFNANRKAIDEPYFNFNNEVAVLPVPLSEPGQYSKDTFSIAPGKQLAAAPELVDAFLVKVHDDLQNAIQRLGTEGVSVEMRQADVERAPGRMSNRIIIHVEGSDAKGKIDRIAREILQADAAKRNYTELSVPAIVHDDSVELPYRKGGASRHLKEYDDSREPAVRTHIERLRNDDLPAVFPQPGSPKFNKLGSKEQDALTGFWQAFNEVAAMADRREMQREQDQDIEGRVIRRLRSRVGNLGYRAGVTDAAGGPVPPVMQMAQDSLSRDGGFEAREERKAAATVGKTKDESRSV